MWWQGRRTCKPGVRYKNRKEHDCGAWSHRFWTPEKFQKKRFQQNWSMLRCWREQRRCGFSAVLFVSKGLSSAWDRWNVCLSVTQNTHRCTVEWSFGFMYRTATNVRACSGWMTLSCFASHLCAVFRTVDACTHCTHTPTHMHTPFLHLSSHDAFKNFTIF